MGSGQIGFAWIDWAIVLGYLAALVVAAVISSRGAARTTRDYFLASGQLPVWLVAISILSTTQSAATFLGGPDQGFRGDYTYLTSFLGALAAAVLVSYVLIPRFYRIGATTVYELLEERFGRIARQAAAGMYLVGRVFAAGARLYMAAIAVAMVVFLRVDGQTITIAAFILLVLGIVFTFVGGIRSAAASDLVQVCVYVGAALVTLVFLLWLIPQDPAAIWAALQDTPPDGRDKLTLVNLSLGLDQSFSVLAIATGVLLLYAGNFGLDQDTSQRLLACGTPAAAARSLVLSVLVAMPVVWLFITIGQLLHVFYERPDLMGRGAEAATSFSGEKITVFMAFILSEMPPGLRGLVCVGVIAAAAINAGLNAMASVVIGDFVRPWLAARNRTMAEERLVRLGQWIMVASGLAVFGMAVVCYYWQRISDMPLLEFALAVMTFAYAGLIGVYVTAVFTRRGSTASVLAALATGFATILAFQPYVAGPLGYGDWAAGIAFPFQLVLGTILSTLVCLVGSQPRAKELREPL